ncbi:oryzalexin E synthase-like [Oryza brachyantha]|uniref:oryzalexin E synthase-like n=1 Tax=Oryza brachyantha TaxID=4533 RepID=UPI001ADC0607|nr:oryzalexin E synthase-like [Oryza brachyantha]
MTLKLGLTTAVVVSSRDAARVAYEKHDQRHAARAVPDAFRGNGYTERSVLFSPSSDPQWKHLRGINATHIFSPKSLAAVHAIRERKVREIVAYFRAHAGEEMVFGDVLHNGILNLMSSCFFSVDMADVGSESALGLQHLIEGIVELVSKPNVSDFFPFLRQLDLQGLRRQTGRSLDRAFSILDGIIERRLDDSRDNPAGKQGDFLDALNRLFCSQISLSPNVFTTLLNLPMRRRFRLVLLLSRASKSRLKSPNRIQGSCCCWQAKSSCKKDSLAESSVGPYTTVIWKLVLSTKVVTNAEAE